MARPEFALGEFSSFEFAHAAEAPDAGSSFSIGGAGALAFAAGALATVVFSGAGVANAAADTALQANTTFSCFGVGDATIEGTTAADVGIVQVDFFSDSTATVLFGALIHADTDFVAPGQADLVVHADGIAYASTAISGTATAAWPTVALSAGQFAVQALAASNIQTLYKAREYSGFDAKGSATAGFDNLTTQNALAQFTAPGAATVAWHGSKVTHTGIIVKGSAWGQFRRGQQVLPFIEQAFTVAQRPEENRRAERPEESTSTEWT